MKPIIYLSGNMTPSPLFYNAWTDRFIEKVRPRFRITKSNPKTGDNFIVHTDLARLKNSHILVINLGVSDTNHHLTGAIVECYEAYKNNIPVYAFTCNNMKRSLQSDSSWLKSFIAKEFNSESELVRYLLTEETLLV